MCSSDLNGHTANWIFVLCRTTPHNPKHAGISFLLVPMDQPGVEVRPIVNMIRGHEFNEVFFSDARTARANVIGEVDNGWAVANTLLGFERGGRATSLYITYREELDRLLAVAADRGVRDDPMIRQKLAWCHGKVEVMRYLGMRTLTRTLAGDRPGPESSLMKLLWSEYHKEVTQLAVDIYGADALVMSGRAAASGIAGDAVGSPSSSKSAQVVHGRWEDVVVLLMRASLAGCAIGPATSRLRHARFGPARASSGGLVFVRHPDPGGHVVAALRLRHDGVVVDFERAFFLIHLASPLPGSLLKGRFVLGLSGCHEVSLGAGWC